MGEQVNHPDHYTAGGIEVIDIIEDWGLGFHLGNALKYVCRGDLKGTPLLDLQKAEWYFLRASKLLPQELITRPVNNIKIKSVHVTTAKDLTGPRAKIVQELYMMFDAKGHYRVFEAVRRCIRLVHEAIEELSDSESDSPV